MPAEVDDVVITTTTIETIAHVCHEANRAWCEAHGDGSQPLWEKAPDWQRKSSMDAVKLRLHNPDLTPEQQHEAWFKARSEDGWEYGEIKDVENKKNPALVPYSELPNIQRKKDMLLHAIVDALK